MKEKYNLIIIDDHPIVVAGLTTLLSKINSVSIVATFNTGNDIFEYKDLGKINIVLLDVFLPDINGIDLCLKLKKINPKIIVLAVSSQSERSIVMQMIKSGADGYLLKSASFDEFKECITLAINGKLAFSNEVKAMIEKTNVNDLKQIPRLTHREKEIILLLKQGKSTKEISEALFLSFLTIQTHRRNFLNKFQVRNIIELINFVDENGLL
jgi:DNA-binding NarL/FixJ family response regulator